MKPKEGKSKGYLLVAKPHQYNQAFIFLDISIRNHFLKNQGHHSVPCSPLLSDFRKKTLIAASRPPTSLGSAKTKLLNLGEGGKVSQPGAGLGKSRKREGKNQVSKQRLHKELHVNPSPFPSLKAS